MFLLFPMVNAEKEQIMSPKIVQCCRNSTIFQKNNSYNNCFVAYKILFATIILILSGISGKLGGSKKRKDERENDGQHSIGDCGGQ